MRRVLHFPVVLVAVALVSAVVWATPASATRTLTFGVDADTTIRADRPTRSYATTTTLSVDNAPVMNALVRVTVSGVGADVVTNASLRLYVNNASPVAGTAYRVASQSWPESVTWATAPPADATAIASPGKATLNTWVSFDLTSLIKGDGTYSIRITSTNSDGAGYVSREGSSATLRPQLVVTANPPTDTTAPTVSITAPAGGSTVTGLVPVTATANDDTAVTAVDVAVDGAVVGTDTTDPYGVTWDSGLSTSGSHALTAIAHDAAGHATTSDPVAITVANAVDTTKPSPPPNLAATADNATKVTLTWSPSIDDVAIARYEVQRDSVILATVITPGYIDAAVQPGSTVTYAVIAIDPTGNRSDPSTVQVSTPVAPTSFVFAAAGDHGANATTAGSLAALDASPASFYLAVGDLDYDETPTDAAWCDYVHQHMPLKGSSFPFEVVTGNHEDDFGPNGSILNFAACLPDHVGSTSGPGSVYGAEYAFDYPAVAPLARVIMLSPELTVAGTSYHYTPGTPGYQWVSDTIDAARAAGIQWVIVGFHFPCLTAGNYQCASGAALMNLLVQKRVDLILNGHEHSYQRSKQLALDPTTCPSIAATGYNPACVADDGSDGIYPKGAGSVGVISGTFGRGHYNVNRTDPEAPYFAAMDGTTNGFMQYTVTADRLDATFVKTNGTFTDGFSIVAGAVAAADRTPPSEPTSLAADTSVPGRVTLNWTASTDDKGIASYAVYRDTAYVGSTTATSYSDPSVTSGQSYTYAVSAYDTAFNPSPTSAPVSVTVPIASTLTFAPDADASLYSGSPTTNYGSAASLEVDNSPIKNFLIRFTVTGVGTSTVTNAKLRLTCVDNSPNGGAFTEASSNVWTEGTVTWSTAPGAGTTVATIGQVVSGSTYKVDLSSLIHGDGTYTLRITSTNSDGADYASREGALASRPQLIITLGT